MLTDKIGSADGGKNLEFLSLFVFPLVGATFVMLTRGSMGIISLYNIALQNFIQNLV